MAKYRPTADISAPGWTSTAGTLSAAINEAVADDASFITSPVLGASVEPFRFSIGPIAAGAVSKTVRAQRTGTVGDIRLVFFDAGGVEVGASAWQAVTASWANYALPVTLTATATQAEIQVRGEAAFSPLSLFAAGEQGAWYDPSDLSTLFQDSAGTVPVTAVGQPVGHMLDKSGRGNHVTQATGSLKPILKQDGGGRYYLEFDGVDDVLIAASNSQLVGPELGVFYGIVHRNGLGTVLATSKYKCGNAISTTLRFTSLSAKDFDFASLVTVGTSAVFGVRYDSSFDVTAYKNGATIGTVAHSADTSNADSPIRLGQMVSGADRFFGDLYGVVVRKSTFAAGEAESLMTYLNSKTGAY